MKVTLVSQYFPPEPAGGPQRMGDLARQLVLLGHEVRIVAPVPNYPEGKPPAGYTGKAFHTEAFEGARIWRAWVPPVATRGTVRRLLLQLCFLLSGLFALSFVRGSKVVVANSPTLFSGLLGWLLARLARSKFVLYVGDLYPESALATQVLRPGWQMRALAGLASFLYTHSDRLVTTTWGQRRRLIGRGLMPDKLSVVPNGADLPPAEAKEAFPWLRAKHNLDGKILALYAGNFGVAQRLETLLEAAALLESREDIVFVLMGSGSRLPELKAKALELGLKRVIFEPQAPRSAMPGAFASADIALIVLQDAPVFRDVLPSKLFDYLAWGLPILASAEGETADLLRESEAGVAVAPERPEALAQAISELADDPARRLEMRQRGPDFIARGYTRRHAAASFKEVLLQLTNVKEAASFCPDSPS